MCTDGKEWRLKVVGQILEAKILNGNSVYNQPDAPVMVVSQLLLAPFLDVEIENKLGIMPIFFTKKGLSYEVRFEIYLLKNLFLPRFSKIFISQIDPLQI